MFSKYFETENVVVVFLVLEHTLLVTDKINFDLHLMFLLEATPKITEQKIPINIYAR